MKKTYQYIALAALALSFAACSQEDDFTPQGNQKDAPLAIASVGVAELTTRVITDDNELVGKADEIAAIGVFITGGSETKYNTNNMMWEHDGTGWTSDETVVFEGAASDQKIAAYRPYYSGMDGNTFHIDMSEQFDYLYCEYAPLTSNPATITMKHLFAKVTVTAESFGSEQHNPSVYKVELANVPVTADWTVPGAELSNYGSSDGEIRLDNEGTNTFTGYALPNGATSLFLRITMSDKSVYTATVSLDDAETTDETEGLTSGTHYKIGLRIGRDKVDFSRIVIHSWDNDVRLNDGVAEEQFPSIDGTSYTSVSELQTTVKTKLSQEGATSVTIDGYLSDEMHAAVISAISEVKTEGAVINGNLMAGSVTYTTHSTFADALTAWTDGTMLSLLADVPEISEQIKISGNDLVLDLNGKSMTSTISNTLSVTGGELTIRDNVGTGSFTTTGYTVLRVNEDNAVVNFESGTLQAVCMCRGVFNMTGGKIYSETYCAIGYDASGTVNVSGGEVTSTYTHAIYNNYGTLNVSGTAKITSTDGCAIANYRDSHSTTISGDIVLSGSEGEFNLGKKIVLNTQPTGSTQWKVKIQTDYDTGIENGIFATPGEGVTLDPANFASAMDDGYEVQQLEDGSLALVQVATE